MKLMEIRACDGCSVAVVFLTTQKHESPSGDFLSGGTMLPSHVANKNIAESQNCIHCVIMLSVKSVRAPYYDGCCFL